MSTTTLIDISNWLASNYNAKATNREILSAMNDCDGDNWYHTVEASRDSDDSYELIIAWSGTRPNSREVIAYPDEIGTFGALNLWLEDCLCETLQSSCDTSALDELID